ncbi:putative ATP-dependent RNA helicase DDX49 [Ooceraea biroi]|uniref:RNA helicase n=1 Tax=Ooceraea biroi TaxID=2015173 RepID=A0A026W4Q2_OOCBI|nr:putative ATP-dependent RNA helicase DDX49 [Ooceraea biroi]
MSEEIKSFLDLKLNSWLLTQCESMGLKKPTPIQQNCIPRILAGEDCIGCAKTGSGKTLAFALPILQKLCEDPYGIFALILTPTRELAFQIADQFAAIGKAINLKKCVIVGGMDMMVQGLELAKRPHIVVATPGRLADHLDSCNTFFLQRIQFLVLDEADRLLGGHFDEQLKNIFAALPKQKQVLLFSATMTDALDKVKQVASNKVFMWEEEDDDGIATVRELDQRYVLCPNNVVDSFLVEVIRTFRAKNKNGSIMIFTDTCKQCQLLSMTLNDVGFMNVALHAMIKQKERLAALNKFKSNHVQILIATDVAARGLDIPMVELVINHVIPNVPKEYIHRVGRTARAGRNGMAISLITPNDLKLLQAIEDVIGTKLTQYKIDGEYVLQVFTFITFSIKLKQTDRSSIDFRQRDRYDLDANISDETEGRDQIRRDRFLRKENDQ